MRTKLALVALAAGACGVIAAPAAIASAETAQEAISRLESEGYTVNIDRIGTAPLDKCAVTSIRNPQQVTQWVPYSGPGARGERVLVQVVTSQTISVSLDCSH